MELKRFNVPSSKICHHLCFISDNAFFDEICLNVFYHLLKTLPIFNEIQCSKLRNIFKYTYKIILPGPGYVDLWFINLYSTCISWPVYAVKANGVPNCMFVSIVFFLNIPKIGMYDFIYFFKVILHGTGQHLASMVNG